MANSGSVSTELVKANTAIAHLTNTLAENGLYDTGCSKIHPYVGRTANFVTRAHSVGGQLKIIDDCTIEISDFAYDGGGPTVYFYAANNGAFGAEEAFIVGPRINGTLYNNDRFRLTLPDGKTLNDFDGISVWCADFNANFGEANIGDATTQ